MKTYTPNHIPAGARITNVALSCFLLAYGTFGILIDDIYVSGKRTSGRHYHGEPAWILYAAMLFAVLNLLSVVADHYDTRNNEANYKRFAKVTQILGWTCFILALVFDLFVFRKSTKH